MKLLYTTLELEKLKSEAMEEMRRNKECIKQLIHLLKYAIQERDEAKTQLHNLLNKNINIPLTKTAESFPTAPLFKPVKANSSITESNSLSETYNYHSHALSLIDSLLDGGGVSSSEFSNIKTNAVMLNNNQEFDPVLVPKVVDLGSLVIDNLVRGRALPQKGKFLQAVLRAGPLIQTLPVAGPLPRWRNPPQFQPFQMPPLSIRGCEVEALSNVGQLGSRSLNSQSFGQVSCDPAQVQSTASMLNFANMASRSSCPNSLISFGMNGIGYAPLPKRQRFS